MDTLTPIPIRDLSPNYDLVVAGGGVTGAGIFLTAAQMGYRVLLVEARDFAWGTSSRSSKMVHGGLRYLKQGKFGLTRASVRERQALLRDYPGLISPLEFLMPIYGDHGPARAGLEVGLAIYSLMAKKRQHYHVDRRELERIFRGVRRERLKLGLGFMDAQVDDARLVLRLIQEGCALGGHALNYTRARGVERNAQGQVCGVELADAETGTTAFVETPVLINATGAFAEELHACTLPGLHVRPLRGSHLVFPRAKLPLKRVLSFFHPRDNRAVFVFPWENTVFAGTTDVDHDPDTDFSEPRISREEADYLMEGVQFILPHAGLTRKDCLSSMAGVRPILSRKHRAASSESREHGVWEEKGLVSVTGGKLTTFRLLARDTLKAAAFYLPTPQDTPRKRRKRLKAERREEEFMRREFASVAGDLMTRRLWGRYGTQAPDILQAHAESLWQPLADTQGFWAELAHGAAAEGGRHLDDLLLRRVRMGLFLPRGGLEFMDRIRKVAGPGLGWGDDRWKREIKNYETLWNTAYASPWSPVTQREEGGVS